MTLATNFERLIYDKNSPSGLIWKSNGKVAGSLRFFKSTPKGWLVGYNGKQILSHHIVLMMHGVEIPEGHIVDHIDGDTSNNSIDNLRTIFPAFNARNCKQRVDNSSGKTGMTFSSTEKGLLMFLTTGMKVVNKGVEV